MHTLGYLGPNVLNPALEQLDIPRPVAPEPKIHILAYECQVQIEPPAFSLHRLALQQLVNYDRYEENTFYAEYPVDPDDPYWFLTLRCDAVDRHLYGDNVVIRGTTSLMPPPYVHADWDEEWLITPRGVTRSFVPFDDEPTGTVELGDGDIYGLLVDLTIGGASRPLRTDPDTGGGRLEL